jgi:hypothetical protein
VPILVALVFYKKDSLKVALVLLAGIIIDIDHLIASPIFDAVRCSINFHPLHSYWAIVCYVLLFIIPKTRIWGLAFLIHILADYVDCLFLGT